VAKLLDWRGAQVLSAVKEATKAAMNETTMKAVEAAHTQLYPGHGFITGLLHGSLKSEPATEEGGEISARWGSFDVNYALYIETRYGYLRYGADAEYPGLAKRMVEHLG